MREKYKKSPSVAERRGRIARRCLFVAAMMVGATSDHRPPAEVVYGVSSETIDDADVTVMTANVRGFEGYSREGSNAADVLAVIDSKDPDVVCFQEFNIDNQPDIVESLTKRGYGLIFSATVRQGIHGQREGNAIAVRARIDQSKSQDLPQTGANIPRKHQQAQITSQLGGISITNTHLGLQPSERLRQARYIQSIDSQQSINCGDYNEDFSKAFVTGHHSQSLTILNKNKDNSTAYQPNFPTHSSGSHIDIISTDCGKIISKPLTYGIDSDHLAVIAKFDLSSCHKYSP